MSAPVYIVSTGRAGSTFVASMLSAGGSISHQLPGSRILNILGNLVQAGRISAGAGFSAAARFGFDGSATADPLRSMLIAAGIRTGRIRGARVVHVVRDPRTFVTSFMNWKSASAKRQVLHHAVPFWQPNPWLSGTASLGEWAAMSKFEHFCWIWNYKNRLFQNLAEHCEYRMFRFEDLTTRDEVVSDLAGFVQIPAVAPARAGRVNASEGSFPSWRDWSRDEVHTLSRHCSELMTGLDYGTETEWRVVADRAAAPVG